MVYSTTIIDDCEVISLKDWDTKMKFVELRACGNSFDSISKTLKCSKQTLIDWSKELEIEISNLQAIRLDELQHKYYATKEARIEILGSNLRRIVQEIEGRNLSNIPTDKLMDILVKLVLGLKSEYKRPELLKQDNLEGLMNEVTNRRVRWNL